MKNKPHPRWSQKSHSSASSEADHTPDLSPTDGSSDGDPPSSPPPYPNQRSAQSLPNIYLTPVSASSGAASSCESLLNPPDFNYLSACSGPSPGSSLSNSPDPSNLTLPRVVVDDTTVHDGGNYQVNVESLLAATSLEPSMDGELYGRMLDQIMHTEQMRYGCEHKLLHQPGATCGCINNTFAYSYTLELSARLRRAVEALGRLSDHQDGKPGCELYSRMSELDRLVS